MRLSDYVKKFGYDINRIHLFGKKGTVDFGIVILQKDSEPFKVVKIKLVNRKFSMENEKSYEDYDKAYKDFIDRVEEES